MSNDAAGFTRVTDRSVASPNGAFDAGLRPDPFPDPAASLLPGLLTATRTGLTPASDDELTNQPSITHLHDQPPTLLDAHGERLTCFDAYQYCIGREPDRIPLWSASESPNERSPDERSEGFTEPNMQTVVRAAAP